MLTDTSTGRKMPVTSPVRWMKQAASQRRGSVGSKSTLRQLKRLLLLPMH